MDLEALIARVAALEERADLPVVAGVPLGQRATVPGRVTRAELAEALRDALLGGGDAGGALARYDAESAPAAPAERVR